MTHNLDLRGIACPLNFVKTKLYLDTMKDGEMLQVSVDAGEPVESVYASIKAEGHDIAVPESKSDGSYLLTIIKKTILLLLLCLCLSYLPAEAETNVEHPNVTTAQIKAAQESVLLSPIDIPKRLQLARLYKANGELRKATIEYLNITAISPSSYIAYHEMLTCRPSQDQVDEALARLVKMDQIKPKLLFARVALSELYERKGDYYQAARALVDLQYAQGIPDKYVKKIELRIHNLLSKTKDIKTAEKAIEQKSKMDEVETSPSTPVPMPDVVVTKEAPADKLRSTKKAEGYGHAQLLP